MRHFFIPSLLVSSTILSLLASCTPCDQSGCDAVDDPVGDVSIAAGIAGAASSESDVVTNGCQECTLSQGTMQIWAVGSAVTTTDEARAVVEGDAPTLELDIDERYEQALDAGEYLVCISNGEICAGVTVSNAVVTVHARYVFGPPSLIVFEPGSNEPRTERIFDLGPG